jgi:hypothetical protein
MSEPDRILSGRISFTTDDFFIQLVDNGEFLDLSGPGTFEPGFEEFSFHHHKASVLGHIGTRLFAGTEMIKSLIARKIVSQVEIAERAYFISLASPERSALDNWLSAERQSLE